MRQNRPTQGGTALLVAVVLAAGALPFMSAPSSAQPEPRAWLALGDSYSSGEGIPGTADVDAAQDYQGRDCRRSIGDDPAWPVLAFRRNGGHYTDGVTQDFVACTGAVADQLEAQVSEARARGGHDRWDVVTVSIGGNDVGFADIIERCVDKNHLGWGSFDLSPGCDIDTDGIAERIRGFVPGLPGVYDSLAGYVEAGGDVLVAGYPQIVEHADRWVGWGYRNFGSCEGIRADDVRLLRGAADALNSAIRTEVEHADARHRDQGVRFHFLDLAHDVYETNLRPENRHALCSTEPWLNGITFGVTSGDLRTARSFHPHSEGHKQTGFFVGDFIEANVKFDDMPEPVPEAPVPSGPGTHMQAAVEFVRSAVAGDDYTHLLAPTVDRDALAAQTENYQSFAQFDGRYEPQQTPAGEAPLESEGCYFQGDITVRCDVEFYSEHAATVFQVFFRAGAGPFVTGVHSPLLDR